MLSDTDCYHEILGWLVAFSIDSDASHDFFLVALNTLNELTRLRIELAIDCFLL